MHILPNATLKFINNSATDFGGGLGVNTFLDGNDTTVVLNNFCFIQYNIGGMHEYEPDKWNVSNLSASCCSYGSDKMYSYRQR